MSKTKALVVLSGGQDSTTCLFWAKQRYDEIHAITFDYGQRHRVEIESAIKIASMAGVASHELISLGPILKGTSPLVNPEHQVESYANAEVLPGGIEKTFVPMRNALFLTVAANRAAVLGCEAMITGVSQEDYGGYPDCREDFLVEMQDAIHAALDGAAREISVIAPLLRLNKMETVRLAVMLPGCMDALAYSHTCYKGEVPPCGSCHACLLRARGFDEAMTVDPLVLRTA